MRKKKKTEAWGAAYFPSSNPPAVDSNLSKKKKNKENKTIALGGVFFCQPWPRVTHVNPTNVQ